MTIPHWVNPKIHLFLIDNGNFQGLKFMENMFYLFLGGCALEQVIGDRSGCGELRARRPQKPR